MEEIISKPQYAELEMYADDIIHCPVCGYPTQSQDGEFNACKHLEFIYIGELDEFIYKKSRFERNTNFLDYEYFQFSDFRDFLQKAEYGNSFLVLEVTYETMACGPVCSTDIYGFDFYSEDDE